MRIFAPDKSSTWDVGVRLRAALRQARAESQDQGGNTFRAERPCKKSPLARILVGSQVRRQEIFVEMVAAYQSWLKVLKHYKRPIFMAASAASKAHRHIMELEGTGEQRVA